MQCLLLGNATLGKYSRDQESDCDSTIMPPWHLISPSPSLSFLLQVLNPPAYLVPTGIVTGQAAVGWRAVPTAQTVQSTSPPSRSPSRRQRYIISWPLSGMPNAFPQASGQVDCGGSKGSRLAGAEPTPQGG